MVESAISFALLTSAIFASVSALPTGTALSKKSPQVATPQAVSYPNGVATLFWQNGNAGACGVVHEDSELLIALSADLFDQDKEGWCGKYITITNTGAANLAADGASGKGTTIQALVTDRCPADECAPSHLDLSMGAFTKLTSGPTDMGTFDISWEVAAEAEAQGQSEGQ